MTHTFAKAADVINGTDPGTLGTIVFQFSEKGPNSDIHVPNASYTYQLLVEGFAPYEVVVIQELMGNLDWDKRLEDLRVNYTGVSTCLQCFEGGSDKLPYPNVILTTAQIEQAMQVADVKMIEFDEFVSWHVENRQNISMSYVKEILSFCRSHNLRVLWTEWKISEDVQSLLEECIAGYEDIVTFLYQTNNQYNQSFVGFMYASQFMHWGGSTQSWWKDATGENRWDLPLYLMVENVLMARSMGAEIIEFEPYWYFFDNGEPLETMRTIWAVI